MDLPAFKRPPVVERVLTYQFQQLPEFDVVHYGLWYDRIRQRFPIFDRQPMLSRIVEVFPLKARPVIQFGLESTPPLPRCVFAASEDDFSRLHQLQPDRFAMNWRRELGHEYISFEEAKVEFATLWADFGGFCAEQSLTSPQIDLCEVTYVNRIECPAGTQLGDRWKQVFSRTDLSSHADWLPNPRVAAINRVYDFQDQRGRLYAEATVGTHCGKDVLVLKMTGRTLVEPQSDCVERLQLAHDWVVKGFGELTTEEARRDEWGQYK